MPAAALGWPPFLEDDEPASLGVGGSASINMIDLGVDG